MVGANLPAARHRRKRDRALRRSGSYAVDRDMNVFAGAGRALFGLGILATAGSSVVAGQTARVEGRVHDEVTGQPLPNARVRIVGTSRETHSDSLGAYRLDRLTAGPFTLRVDADRYTSVQQDFELDSGAVVVIPLAVSPIAVLLEQLSVRAAAGGRPSAVTRQVVRAEQLPGHGGRSAGDALSARVTGARVLFQSGTLGTATQVLLRGAKSLSLPGEPLYYVDGVPMSAAEPGSRTRPGQQSILDVIDPATIERIEVLSGAAASAAFGLGSNNGVILIYTKRE